MGSRTFGGHPFFRESLRRERTTPARSCSPTPLPSAELFTVYIDHSFSSTVGIAASGNSLSGALLDQDGNRVNPCNVYIRRGLACPDIINIGVPNKNDIVPLAALLDAAGILSLDAMGKGASGPGIANNLLRYSGLILYVQITYFNFYSPTPPSVRGWFDSNIVPFHFHCSVALAESWDQGSR